MGQVLDRVLKAVAACGNGLHGHRGGQGGVASSVALLGVELAGPILLDLGAVSTAAAERVRVLCTAARTGSAHDSRDTSTLAPPFNGVLHTGHGSALADVSTGTVRLASVGTARGNGQFHEVFTNFRLKGCRKVHLGAVRHFDVEACREFAGVHLGLGDRVDDVFGSDLHLQAPCLDAVLTYVISLSLIHI